MGRARSRTPARLEMLDVGRARRIAPRNHQSPTRDPRDTTGRLGMNESDIRESIRGFILEEFLPGEDASELTDAVELFTSGILDSVATLKLVSFLEEEFDISIDAHEADTDNLNTIESIGKLVLSKK
jgi:acyl carrier protein